MAHTDDFLFLCHTRAELHEVYAAFVNFLHSVELRPNIAKVQEGRFAGGVLEYCGYRFAGGYVNISPVKITRFKEEIRALCSIAPVAVMRRKPWSERAYIKNINKKLNGFGHYYKYGNVTGTFEKADAYVRGCIRQAYRQLELPCPANKRLAELGLRSLVKLAQGEKEHIISAHRYAEKQKTNRTLTDKTSNAIYLGYMEQLTHQNSEIIKLLKKLLKSAEETNALLNI